MTVAKMHNSKSDDRSIINSRISSQNVPLWKSNIGSDTIPVSAKEYVALQRYKRNIGRPFRTTGGNAAAISCVILSTLLVFVGTLFLALYLVTTPLSGGWSSWSHWSECSRSCDGGERFRNRTCTRPRPDPGGDDCRGGDTEMDDCNTQFCEGVPYIAPPDIENFSCVNYVPGMLESYYICNDTSLSIDVNSGSQVCPKVVLKNGQWEVFSATCGQGRTFGTEMAGIGGSFYASSGNITSPGHPAEYPDEYGVYHWTVVSTGSSINFHFTALNTTKTRPDCKGNSGVAIYCGINIPPLEPTHGYYCGSDLPPNVTCSTTCAIVRFVSIPVGSAYTGFRLEWNDGDR